MEWTDESITRLRSLWHEGLSTAEIGRRMQITKNAVVGKAHRLTLSPRPSPIRKAPEKPEPTPIVASAAAMPRPASSASPEPAASSSDATPPQRRPLSVVGAPPPGPQPATLADAEPPALRPVAPAPRRRGLTCCWPLGEPGTKDFHFCGGDPVAGKPYCATHAALAYVRIRDRRENVA